MFFPLILPIGEHQYSLILPMDEIVLNLMIMLNFFDMRLIHSLPSVLYISNALTLHSIHFFLCLACFYLSVISLLASIAFSWDAPQLCWKLLGYSELVTFFFSRILVFKRFCFIMNFNNLKLCVWIKATYWKAAGYDFVRKTRIIKAMLSSVRSPVKPQTPNPLGGHRGVVSEVRLLAGPDFHSTIERL